MSCLCCSARKRIVSSVVMDTRPGKISFNNVCGRTVDGVVSYSNGSHESWTASKHVMDGLFMGYKWQCVEFARRWLWQKYGLLLPQRSCASDFIHLRHVYRPLLPPAVIARRTRASPLYTDEGDLYRDGAQCGANDEEDSATSSGYFFGGDEVKWEKVACVVVRQGSTEPPRPNSLIIYPRSWGSPFGHIGVITSVDLHGGVLCVADQNRYFHGWLHNTHSASFRLECVQGRYYIRDPESECTGWIPFGSAEHSSEQ